MRVYISGKIGEEVISEATRRKFAKAEKMLQAKGYETFNPCNGAWQRELVRGYQVQLFSRNGIPANAIPFYDYVLLRDLMMMSLYDSVYFLNDWMKSPGAKCEHDYAMATGKKLLFEDRFQAHEHLVDEMYKLVRQGFPPGVYLDHDRFDAENKYAKMHLDRVWLPID